MEQFIGNGEWATGSTAANARSVGRPFAIIEYIYYAAVFYGYMGEAIGLSIGMLGAGTISLLALFCTLRLRNQSIFSSAVALPILFAVSFTMVQIIVHGESLMDATVRPIVVWALTVIILIILCLNRPGFITRFATAMFVIGLTAMPFLDLSDRARIDAATGVLQNANGLSVFFGFIAVVFTVRGLNRGRSLARWLHMAIALTSLLIVALTVSRSPLAVYTVVLVIALRKHMGRSFIPLLILVTLAAGAFAVGVFDNVIVSYQERGLEDTGRLVLWPRALARYVESPIAGVGVSKVGIDIPTRPDPVTPHNSFLFVGLSSGIIPLLFFAGYWFMGLRGALKTSPHNRVYPYLLPLWAYAFLMDQFGSQGFLEPWSTLCVCICLVQLIPKQPRWCVQLLPSVHAGVDRPEMTAPVLVRSHLWTRK